MDVNDESNSSCSGGFELLSAEDVTIDNDVDWTPGMTVTSPKEGDLAYAGETYTVLVSLIARKHSSSVCWLLVVVSFMMQ